LRAPIRARILGAVPPFRYASLWAPADGQSPMRHHWCSSSSQQLPQGGARSQKRPRPRARSESGYAGRKRG